MSFIDELFERAPYSMRQTEKEAFYQEALVPLTQSHYENCAPYRRLLDALGFDPSNPHPVADIPFLPVRLFKEYELLSVDRSDIVKTMTSSGTSGQQVSKIFLDRTTAAHQTKTLVKIVSDFLGKKRLPLLIVDTKAVVKNRQLFSARGSGILGFSMMGHDVTYALDEDMALDIPAVTAFLERHRDEKIFLFGFTYIVWAHLYKAVKEQNLSLDLSNALLIHGGGFKKLAEESVDNAAYKAALESALGIKEVYNYYGMVEQTGSIFMGCAHDRLHASNYSDIIIRRPEDFAPCAIGEKGLIELVSLLPESYPGHCLLSEDVGELLGVDDCPCGRNGKTFKIHGRIAKAEVRGCSDTYGRR
ncbi:LuxE/PaaK family acyltransferase [Fusibacter sp. JL298sf-3]